MVCHKYLVCLNYDPVGVICNDKGDAHNSDYGWRCFVKKKGRNWWFNW